MLVLHPELATQVLPPDEPELAPDPTPLDPQRLHGATLWPAAHALIEVLQTHAEWSAALVNASVVELGAGATGHVGVAAARIGGAGTRVVLCDKHVELVEGAASAVASSSLCGQLSAELYEWGDAESPLCARAPFDVVLASDCTYSHGCAGAFCDALDALAGPSSRVLISCGHRWSMGECLDVCAERGWAAVPVLCAWTPSPAQLDAITARVREQCGADGIADVYEMVRATKCDAHAPGRSSPASPTQVLAASGEGGTAEPLAECTTTPPTNAHGPLAHARTLR